MRTTATNRKLRELLTDIRDEKLIPRPEFQRKLVWTNRDKVNFLDTVLRGYPFPEIYTAAGSVNTETGYGTTLLVDGQQRVTTLYQYFHTSQEIKLGRSIQPYTLLSQQEKEDFLDYDVVVRDLGLLNIDQIRDVFVRINATAYSLNAMEIQNARFNGALKQFADEIAQDRFFDAHRIFSANEIRRMSDIRYVLAIIISSLSTYFNRNVEIERWLEEYNDEFPVKEALRRDMHQVFTFCDQCDFGEKSRVWQQSDLFTLLVELYRFMFIDRETLTAQRTGEVLRRFYR